MISLIQQLKKTFDKLPIQVRTSIIYVIFSVIQKGVSFIVVPIYTRVVSTEQYGMYSIYQSWDAVLNIFATLCMWNYLFSKGMLKYKEKKDAFISALIGLGFVTTGVLFIVFIIFKEMLIELSGLPLEVFILMFLSFLFRPAYEYWCARQRFEFDIKKYVLTAIIIAIITPVSTLVLVDVFKRVNNSDLGVALILGKVLCAVFVYVIVLKYLISKSHKLYDKSVWKYALRFNLPLIPHFLSGVLLSQSDKLMIGWLCSKSEVAYYSIAYSTVSIIGFFNAAIMDSIIPWMYKKMEKNEYKGIAQITTIATMIIITINLLVVLFAPEIIAIMGPEEYRVAIYIMPPVAMSNVFMFLFNLFANIEYYYEQTKYVAFSSCISAISNIIMNLFLIPRFGFIAAGYTTLACYIIYALCHYVFMKITMKKFGQKNRIYNNIELWVVALVSCVIAVFCILIYNYFIVRLIFVVVITIITMIVLVCTKGKILKLIQMLNNKSD